MTKVTEIQELIDFITKSGLQEVKIETEVLKIHIKRSMALPQPIAPSAAPMPLPVAVPAAAPELAAPVPLPIPTPAPVPTPTPAHYKTVTAPMIGTFYRAPNPDAPPFVQVGDVVAKGAKLCIIEAMKLYNQIEAEFAGKIVEILVEDVSPVEYDQPLFVLDPA